MRSVSTGAMVAFLLAIAPATAAAAPSCAEGPQTNGETIVGTPCDDAIRAPRGVTTVRGEGGNDVLYGQRGNDSLFGGEGADRLYGGVGDDHPRGGPGNDLLSGGFGADSLDGEGGDDIARGDATVDAIGDTGGGTDTLSFATGVTPGFPNEGPVVAYAGFPDQNGERGVFVELGDDFANDGIAPNGGGVDEPFPPAVDFASFETVIGTPFSDILVGTPNAEVFYGGGGADVILGKGGGDQVFGGAGGDYCEAAGGSAVSCEFGGATKAVGPRDPGAIAVGRMSPRGSGPTALYLTGSDGDDEVVARYTLTTVVFELGGGSEGSFDAGETVAGECDPPSSNRVVCRISQAPDTIVLAGLGGDDSLSAAGFPPRTSVIALGGEDGDGLTGGDTEDALVDGAGDDSVSAAGGDDAVPNNAGTDDLDAGSGEDLFISNAVCEGDVLNGGSERDNANWANFNQPIAIDMGESAAGLIGGGGEPDCGLSPRSTLREIEDVEGTNGNDTLTGDSGPNQLLGRKGADSYFAASGDDSILANSGDADVEIDCGPGFDTAQVDHPEFGDPTPVDCEAIHERDPNSFRPPDTPPGSERPPNPTIVTMPPPEASPPQAPRDRTPPRTVAFHRPGALLLTEGRTRTVSFAFGSSEPGSTFRCRLDRGPFKPCSSPRRYRLQLGRHAVRIYAIDPAGNRDRSPALFKLTVRRR